MVDHLVYKTIVAAVKHGDLREPFSKGDFRTACPGLGSGTYNAFLWKHCVGNLNGETELFVKVSPGRFALKRPLKYGLDV
jgi:hypothetical protein